MPETNTEQKMCFFGASTDHPCRWPATVELWGGKVCRFHAAAQPLWDEVDNLNLVVALLEDELIPRVREHSQAEALLAHLERAKADFEERKEFLGRHLDAALDAAAEPQAKLD